jgi:hypothetical protein
MTASFYGCTNLNSFDTIILDVINPNAINRTSTLVLFALAFGFDFSIPPLIDN